MSAIHAIERALRIGVDPAVRLLRRLFYCDEWIESHTLHVYMLHAPDFLGYQDAIAMARDHRAVVERALRLKKSATELFRSSEVAKFILSRQRSAASTKYPPNSNCANSSMI
jgi:sulfhydrogenase subunit alpha